MNPIHALPSAGQVEYPQFRRYNMRMNKVAKLVPVGNSTGVIIPRDLLAASGLNQGDEVILKASAGRLEVEASTDDFDRQMDIAREVMKRRFKALRELAK